jgi:hypothetical protein
MSKDLAAEITMSQENEGVKAAERVILSFDQDSFGIYPFPFHAVEVTNSNVSAPQTWRAGDLLGTVCKVADPPFPIRPGTRANPSLPKPVLSWMRMAPDAAPLALIHAAPGFWLNRYRRSSKYETLCTGSVAEVDLKGILDQRAEQRRRLREHSQSLTAKFWSMRYHRENLMSAIKEAEASKGGRRLDYLTRATAEFSAHDGVMYSLLEELAVLHSIFEKIRTGKDVTTSFHTLYNSRSKLAPPLGQFLQELEWYEPFRVRRANATHAFGTMIVSSPEDNDIYLYQHPDKHIYGSMPAPAPGRVLDMFVELARVFDRFVDQFCIFLLSLFHPFDVVMLPNAEKPGDPFEETLVWVRSLEFDPSLARETDAWVMQDKSGQIALVAHRIGGLTRP